MSQNSEEQAEKIELFWDINLGTFSNMFFLSVIYIAYQNRKK